VALAGKTGGALGAMTDQFETSEMVDVVEVSYRVIKVKQQKYVCRCGGCVETAPGPERATPGSRYSLTFAIKVAVDKYCDHIPLARQERILARHGLDVTSQTLWDLINALGRRLETVDRALLARVLAQPVSGSASSTRLTTRPMAISRRRQSCAATNRQRSSPR